MEKKFDFGAFWSPIITKESYKQVADCGFTHLFIDAKYGAELGSKVLFDAVSLCGDVGLKAIIQGGTRFSSDTNDYSSLSAFDGVNSDEPLTVGELERLSNEIDDFNKKYPNGNFYVNSVGNAGEAEDLYLEYFGRLITSKQHRKIISGDGYPLNIEGSCKKTFDSGFFLSYLETLARFAKEQGAEFGFYVQAMSISARGRTMRKPSLNDLRFSHNYLLAFGATAIDYFCYKQPGIPPFKGEFLKDDYGLIDYDDNRTEIYYNAQKAIAETKLLEKFWFDYKWQGIMPIFGRNGDSNVDGLKNFRYPFTSFCGATAYSDNDVIIGCMFSQELKSAGLYIVNINDPLEKKTCKGKVVFGHKVIAKVFADKKEIEITADSVYFNLKEGDAAFIRFDSPDLFYDKEYEDPAPKFLTVDSDGIIEFKTDKGRTDVELIVNDHNKGLVKNGDNVVDRLEFGHNRIEVRYVGEKNKSREIFYYRLKEDKSNVFEYQDYSDISNRLGVYNVYGGGKSILEVISSGYPEGGSGNILKLSTGTEKDHDWSTFQILNKPIENANNKTVYIKIFLTSSDFSLECWYDPMLEGKVGSYPLNTIDRLNRWYYQEVPLKNIMLNDTVDLDQLMMVIGNDIPHGTLAYIDSYFVVENEDK